MEECEKKDIVAIVDDIDSINVHDWLAQISGGLPADVKPNDEVSSSDLVMESIFRNVVNVDDAGKDLKPGTSQDQFFCALCRSHISTTVRRLVFLAEDGPTWKDRVRQRLLKKYSMSVVEEMFSYGDNFIICRSHMEVEKKPVTLLYCALCRQQIPDTVPNILVPPDAICREQIREQLQKKYSKWKVDHALGNDQLLFICQTHLEIEESCQEENERTVCSFCDNQQILLKYTTVVPSTPKEQELLRKRIVDDSCLPERLTKVFELAQQLVGTGMGPFRLCSDHVWDEEVRDMSFEKIPRRGRLQERSKEETIQQAVEHRRRARERYQRIKEDPEKCAEEIRKRNERRKLSRQRETNEQREARRQKGRESDCRRRKRKREEKNNNGSDPKMSKQDEESAIEINRNSSNDHVDQDESTDQFLRFLGLEQVLMHIEMWQQMDNDPETLAEKELAERRRRINEKRRIRSETSGQRDARLQRQGVGYYMKKREREERENSGADTGVRTEESAEVEEPESPKKVNNGGDLEMSERNEETVVTPQTIGDSSDVKKTQLGVDPVADRRDPLRGCCNVERRQEMKEGETEEEGE